LPSTKSALLVVEILPFPSMNVATLAVEPEILAVGVPVKTFLNANLALVVALAPKSKSSVVLPGYIVPVPRFQ